MAGRAEAARRRRWADIVVIVVGFYAWVTAYFAVGLMQPRGVARQVTNLGWYWGAMALCGALAIASVIVALRSTIAARILVVLAGLSLLSTLFVIEAAGARELLFIGVPALLLLAMTPFIGPMPTPEEEKQRR